MNTYKADCVPILPPVKAHRGKHMLVNDTAAVCIARSGYVAFILSWLPTEGVCVGTGGARKSTKLAEISKVDNICTL